MQLRSSIIGNGPDDDACDVELLPAAPREPMEALRGEPSDEDENADEPGRCRVTKPCEDRGDHHIEQRGTETDEEGFTNPVQ